MTGIHKSDMKLKGITNAREIRKRMQRNLDRLETQSENISVTFRARQVGSLGSLDA